MANLQLVRNNACSLDYLLQKSIVSYVDECSGITISAKLRICSDFIVVTICWFIKTATKKWNLLQNVGAVFAHRAFDDLNLATLTMACILSVNLR